MQGNPPPCQPDPPHARPASPAACSDIAAAAPIHLRGTPFHASRLQSDARNSIASSRPLLQRVNESRPLPRGNAAAGMCPGVTAQERVARHCCRCNLHAWLEAKTSVWRTSSCARTPQAYNGANDRTPDIGMSRSGPVLLPRARAAARHGPARGAPVELNSPACVTQVARAARTVSLVTRARAPTVFRVRHVSPVEHALGPFPARGAGDDVAAVRLKINAFL